MIDCHNLERRGCHNYSGSRFPKFVAQLQQREKLKSFQSFTRGLRATLEAIAASPSNLHA